MKKNFKFSVIIPIYNVEEYLEETLESVINQTIGFEQNIELVLINDGSPDNSEKICLKYKEKYPENVVYYKQENAGVSMARNKGMEFASGEFTTFLDSDDLWSKDAFEEMYKEYLNHLDVSLYSCKMCFFDARKGEHPLNYKYVENKVVNILEDYAYPQLSSSSIFIKTDVVKKYKYDKTIKYSEDNKFINEIIFDEEKIMMLKNPIYYYRKRTAGTSAIQGQVFNDDWYLVTPKKVYRYLYDLSKKKFGRVIEYIEYLVCYDLSWRVVLNPKVNLSSEVQEKYAKLLKTLIEDTDDEMIYNHKHLNLFKKIFFLELKGKKKVLDEIVYEEDSIAFHNLKIKKKNLGFLIIDQIYLRENNFILFGKVDRKYVPEKGFHVMNDGEEVPVLYYELTNNFNEITFSGDCLHDYIGIKVQVKLSSLKKLEFYNKDNYLIPRFKRSSIFTEYLYRSYHHVGKNTLVFKKSAICKEKRNLFRTIYYELRNEMNLLKRKRFKALLARAVTCISRLFKRKELWLISDRFNKADDNGEHFFEYMIRNHPDKNVYYVLSKKSVDYERMSKKGKVIDPHSNKYKLMFHRADYVVSSHAENYIFNPLGRGGKYVQDLYYFKYIFLQHGVTLNNLSTWINVNTKKMDLFVTSCEKEYNSLLEYKYYFDSEIVKLTGMPRFDGLLEKKQKIKERKTIMLSLTWRRGLASSIDRTTDGRVYSEDFKNSEYFKNLNNLMNDKRLLKVLKEKGYKIRFIPHPNVLPQLDDFTKNEYIEIEEGSVDYQKEFCENKLLVTDYSSVAFDFAFLKKPVVYFQNDIEEFYAGQIYEKGYFDFETMGFGPVIQDYDKLVETIIELVKDDCKLDKKYQKRIKNFFKFHDNKNCERVYNEIINLNKK